MKKRYILLAILVILAAGGLYLSTNIESIVKKVVHKYGSEVTGTDVNISGFDLSLKDGTATIKKITVANPNGYKTPHIFELGDISVKIDLKSLTKDTIIIEKVDINKPIITYEMASLTKNNISDIQNNINSFANKAPKESVAKETKSEGSGKNVIIKTLRVEGGELGAHTNIQGFENNVVVKLPPIQINDIGGTSEGKSIAQTISDVVSHILTAASQTVVKGNLADVKNVAKENLDGAVSSAKERVNETKDILKNLGKF